MGSRSIKEWRERMQDFANGDRISDNETHCTDVEALLDHVEEQSGMLELACIIDGRKLTRIAELEADVARLRTLLGEACDLANTLGRQAETPERSQDEGWATQFHTVCNRIAAIRREGGGE